MPDSLTLIAYLPLPSVETSDSYISDIANYIPKNLYRAIPTPRKLVKVCAEAMRLHHHDIPEVAEATGLALDTVDDIVEHGKGNTDDVIDVLNALGVTPVSIPPFDQLKKGVRP